MSVLITFEDLERAWPDFLTRFSKVDYRPFRGVSLKKADSFGFDYTLPAVYQLRILRQGLDLPRIFYSSDSQYNAIIVFHSPYLTYEARLRSDGSLYFFATTIFDNQPRGKWERFIKLWIQECVVAYRQQSRCAIYKQELIEIVFRKGY